MGPTVLRWGVLARHLLVQDLLKFVSRWLEGEQALQVGKERYFWMFIIFRGSEVLDEQLRDTSISGIHSGTHADV